MLKILIAEDEVIIRLYVASILKKAKDRIVSEAGTGQKAVELSREFKPDVIFMDISMGDKRDGLVACREIKKNDAGVKIVFLSAYPEYKKLIKKIALHNQLQSNNIALANGSDGVIKYIFDASTTSSKLYVFILFLSFVSSCDLLFFFTSSFTLLVAVFSVYISLYNLGLNSM